MSISHIAFSDEANWNHGRIRGLCVISLEKVHEKELCQDITNLLNESSIAEFAWKNVSGARERFAAIKLSAFAIQHALRQRLRIDCLTWDAEDSRHRIRTRDDVANLERMYYHLFKNVMLARWPNNTFWHLFPDEHTAINWNDFSSCLSYKESEVRIRQDIFTHGRKILELCMLFKLKGVSPITSAHPLIQIADLFVGMAIFSRTSCEKLFMWQQANEEQKGFFDEPIDLSKFTKSEKERCRVLIDFYNNCKKNKMGVSLKTSNGLRTFTPKKSINFWWYEPQNEFDKAPVKQRKNVRQAQRIQC